MEEEHAVCSQDQTKPYISINYEDIEKQYNEESDGIQLTEDQYHPSSSHAEVPYDLQQLRAYTTSYHSISLDYQYDGVVDLPHHADLYISHI